MYFLSFKTLNLPEEKSTIQKKTEFCPMLRFIWVEIKKKLGGKVDSYLQPAENAVVPSLAKTEDLVARGGDTLAAQATSKH